MGQNFYIKRQNERIKTSSKYDTSADESQLINLICVNAKSMNELRVSLLLQKFCLPFGFVCRYAYYAITLCLFLHFSLPMPMTQEASQT